MIQESLHFSGPFSFQAGKRSLFHSQFAKNEGIYIWVNKDKVRNLNYIHYVGETTGFARRHREHIAHILSMNYYTLDAESAARGEVDILWQGMWRDKTEDAVANTLAAYRAFSSKVFDYVSTIDVYFAPTTYDMHTRRHVEGSIGWNLRNNHPEHKRFYPDDNHVGTKKEKLGITLSITSDEPILSLDSKLSI